MLKSVSGVFRCFVIVDITCSYGPITSFCDGINLLMLAAMDCEKKLKNWYKASSVSMIVLDDSLTSYSGVAGIRCKFSFESGNFIDISDIALQCTSAGRWFESFFGNRSITVEDFESVIQ